ncbi:hypothetical protein KHA80_06580 [Anaerobacillus sp. HL2]|nr:hypothetical protein KHA80_06580 [Anaerobacillus sp. HL2]
MDVVKRHLPNQEIAAAVMIDHHSRNIVAISGGKDYIKSLNSIVAIKPFGNLAPR